MPWPSGEDRRIPLVISPAKPGDHWLLVVRCWMLDVFVDQQVALLRALLAHALRAAVRPGGDGGRGARPPRLAGLAHLWADPRRDGLRADLRHEFQPDRGPKIRRAEPAHRPKTLARRPDQSRRRGGAVGAIG